MTNRASIVAATGVNFDAAAVHPSFACMLASVVQDRPAHQLPEGG